MDCSLPGSSAHGDSPGKNAGVGCHALLQGVFPIQGLNPRLLHCRRILYYLSHQGSPSTVYRCVVQRRRLMAQKLKHTQQLLRNTKKMKVKSLSRVRLFATPRIVAHQAPPSMGFSSQEYWTGLPFPSPGDLPNPGIEPGSPALQADTLLSEPPGKHHPDCWESDNANCALWALWGAGFLRDSAKRATSTRDVRVVREKILGISFAKKLINRNFN